MGMRISYFCYLAESHICLHLFFNKYNFKTQVPFKVPFAGEPQLKSILSATH